MTIPMVLQEDGFNEIVNVSLEYFPEWPNDKWQAIGKWRDEEFMGHGFTIEAAMNSLYQDVAEKRQKIWDIRDEGTSKNLVTHEIAFLLDKSDLPKDPA